MNYIEKIQLNAVNDEIMEYGESLTVPHQAFTPRDILKQFVMNDVQVMTHHPTDNISVNDLNEQMDDLDFETIQQHIVDFEDEFEAREASRDALSYKRVRNVKKKSVKESEEKPKEEEQLES